PKIVKLLEEQGAGDKLVVGGGIIPEDDIKELNKAGVTKVFTPGTTTTEIVEYIRTEMASRT
ncbi:MAG: methylmalonyl-CoA mutase, partial [bacterium]